MLTLKPSAVKLLFAVIVVISTAANRAAAETTLGVDSPAARFSPGNWAGDAGRGGSVFRRTWNNGAWCQWRWTTPAEHPTAKLQITNQTTGSTIAYFLDGALTEKVAVSDKGDIPIAGLKAGGSHTLIVYTAASQQTDRWQGKNAFVVSGLTVDEGSAPLPAEPSRPWALIIGDSITEGIGAGSSLGDYAFLVGQGLRGRGIDTSVSACGYSGWIRPGDGKGDVPPYYAVNGGVYAEATSRWNKIDSQTSLLDAKGHLSGQGQADQEPAVIVINYIVNETLGHANVADAQASVTGCLAALRTAAPKAMIIVLMPPGLADARVYPGAPPYIAALRDGVGAYEKAHPDDKKIELLDLGADVARALGSQPYGGGVHPNPAGHAYQAPMILQAILRRLEDPDAEQKPIREIGF
jgi:lysophospholipase L1-like esterase